MSGLRLEGFMSPVLFNLSLEKVIPVTYIGTLWESVSTRVVCGIIVVIGSFVSPTRMTRYLLRDVESLNGGTHWKECSWQGEMEYWLNNGMVLLSTYTPEEYIRPFNISYFYYKYVISNTHNLIICIRCFI